MATLGKLVLVLLIVTAAFVWVTQVHPVFAVTDSDAPSHVNAQAVAVPDAPFSFSLSNLSASAIAAERAQLSPVSTDGVVFIDSTSGSPGTPYFIYQKAKGDVEVKELLFLKGNEEACQITAGEYPCARDISGYDPSNSDASPVPSGTFVHLDGGIDDQGIIVQNLQSPVTPVLPSNMVRFSTQIGAVTSISNDTTISPIAMIDDASCTLGVGCYPQGQQRLEVYIASKNSHTTTELVPGSVFVFGKSSIVLLSISGTGAEATGNFLVASR
jgi:hypothetical protein